MASKNIRKINVKRLNHFCFSNYIYSSSWVGLIQQLDEDVWGNGYKIVTRAIADVPPRKTLQ